MTSKVSIPSCVKPPKGAYRYLPPPDQVLHGHGKNLHRSIFKGQTFTALEEKKLKRLEALIAAGKLKPYKLPENWDRSDLLKFVYGTSWKTAKALRNLQEHLKWRAACLPSDYRILYPDVRQILQTGCMYVHGRDERYRPLIISRAYVYDFNKYSVEDYMRTSSFLLEYILDNILLPGQIENWIVLTDMGKQGLNLSYKSLKKIIDMLQLNYRGRLAHNFVVNAPGSIMLIWNVVKHFLDDVTKEKTDIEKGNVSRRLLDLFSPNQLEQKYGGSAPNLTEFWPPHVPEGPFQRNPEDVEGLKSDYASFDEDIVSHLDKESTIKKKRSMSSPGRAEQVDEDESLELDKGYGVFDFNPNESDKQISFHIEEEVKVGDGESFNISFHRNEKVFINRSCNSSLEQNSFELDLVASLESSNFKENFEPLRTQKIVIPPLTETSPDSDPRNEKTEKLYKESTPIKTDLSIRIHRAKTPQEDKLKVENENLRSSCFGLSCGDFDASRNGQSACTML